MERFLNALKAQAGTLDQSSAQPRFATVTSVDPATATARVTLQPEGVLSGWLPVLSPWTGAGGVSPVRPRRAIRFWCWRKKATPNTASSPATHTR